MTGYVTLPNYRNYWKHAGYVEEMDAVETALATGSASGCPSLMSDAWLRDCTLQRVGLARSATGSTAGRSWASFPSR